MQCDAEPVTPPATTTPANLVESADERKRKKKKKKRKRENDDGEKATERECVPSHLDTSHQEEDWCQAGMWSLASHPDTEQSEQKPQLAAATPTRCKSDQKEQGGDSVKLKKKKKKKKKIQLTEALRNTTSACSALETWVEVYDSMILFLNILQTPTMPVGYMPTYYEKHKYFSASTFHIFSLPCIVYYCVLF